MNNHNPPSIAGFALTNLALSADGQVCLSVAELPLISLVHLVSGMDEDTPQVSGSAAVATDLTGYTEWVTVGSPAISIGWDWQLLTIANHIKLKRLGLPRNNLSLRDSTGKEIGQHGTDQVLAEFIDNIPWKEKALQFIGLRYHA